MATEIVGAYVVAGVMIATNIVGWTISSRRMNKNSNKNEIRHDAAYDERVKNLVDDVSKLPCVKDPAYYGQLIGTIKTIDERTKRLEENTFDGS